MWKISAPLNLLLNINRSADALLAEWTRLAVDGDKVVALTVDLSHVSMLKITVPVSAFEVFEHDGADVCYNPSELLRQLEAVNRFNGNNPCVTLTFSDRVVVEADGFTSEAPMLDSVVIPSPRFPALGHTFEFNIDTAGLNGMMKALGLSTGESGGTIGGVRKGRVQEGSFGIVFSIEKGEVAVSIHSQDRKAVRLVIGRSDGTGRVTLGSDLLKCAIKAMPGGVLTFRGATDYPAYIKHESEEMSVEQVIAPRMD